MDKIARIRQEIKRLRQEIKEEKEHIALNQKVGYLFALTDMESFLDTLSEKPNKSLEEAAEIIAKNILGRDYLAELDEDCAIDALEDAKNLVKAGAEWQASRMPMPEDTVLFQKGVAEGRRLEREDMMKNAVEGYMNYYEDSGGILMAEAQVGCPYHNGDKVRIVVLKEEEE